MRACASRSLSAPNEYHAPVLTTTRSPAPKSSSEMAFRTVLDSSKALLYKRSSVPFANLSTADSICPCGPVECAHRPR